MAEQTRVITVEITMIDDSSTFGPAEKTEAYWRSYCRAMYSHADDLHVTVKDFIQDEEEEHE